MGSQRTLSWLVGLLLIGCLSRTFVERLPLSLRWDHQRTSATLRRAVENPYDVLGLPRGTSKSASVLRYGSVLILAAALVKQICFLVSFLQSQNFSIRLTCAACCKSYKQLKRWWERQQGDADSSSEVELDVMRCNWMRRFLFVGSVLTMCRLAARQISVLREGYTNAEFDLHVLAGAALSLLVTSFPQLITPRSLDLWYVVIMVILDAVHLIPPVEVDVRDVIVFGYALRFIFAVLAKRTGCVAFCILLHFLQATQIARLQGHSTGAAVRSEWLLVVFSMMFLGILIVRRLMRENVLLKVDLQKRTVELGAVSSLLTACYDAVVELDQNLQLTQDSGQLSSMLLQTAPKVGGLAGKSLLDFFSEGDRQRISEQVLSPVEKISVVALNADMLDSDFNHVKVELFCAQFKNLASERCFLVGLRELQDLEPRAAPLSVSLGLSDPSHPEGEATYLVVYDLHSFDIHIMNGEMQRLCRPYLGDTTPDTWTKNGGQPKVTFATCLRRKEVPCRGFAAVEDTRKSFRKIALSEHPDVNPDDPESQERFQKLVSAYNSIMGDEIFPDEVMEIRVQMTKRYQERVKSEMRDTSGLMFMGNARLIQGVITVMFFGILFALSQSDQDTVTSLLLPPSARRGF
eukprot:s3234_g5.t1